MSMPGPLKILHVTETLPGGIATYLRELLLLHKDDPAITGIRVLAPRDQLSHLKELPSEMLRGYERSGRNLPSLWHLARALKAQIAEFRPQVVHLHSSFAGAVGRLLRPWWPKDVRLVYCPHGWAFSRDDSPLARQAYIWIERYLATRCDAWVAISQHEMDAAVGVGIRARHARLIYNGVGDTQHLPGLALPALDSTHLNLLFVGRHDRQKGLDVLLAAMSRLEAQKIRLYVVGAEVVSGTIKREKADNVVWVGWLSGAELIAYYRACDAVVMPSRWEGMPLVALEAMRESRPVLAARREPLPEVVGDGGVLFEPENVEALACLLMTLDVSQLVQWGVRARLRYQEYFRSQRMGHGHSVLYQQLQLQGNKTV
jgi:glycosyltransferase involved in cell wall biosynthesis